MTHGYRANQQTMSKTARFAMIFIAALPSVIQAQTAQAPLTPQMKSQYVGMMVSMRQWWFQDQTRIDGCSIFRVTGDSTYRAEIAMKDRGLVVSPALSACAVRSRGIGTWIEVTGVTTERFGNATTDAVFVEIWVRGGIQGDVRQRYQVAPRSEVSIKVFEPYMGSDRTVIDTTNVPGHTHQS